MADNKKFYVHKDDKELNHELFQWLKANVLYYTMNGMLYAWDEANCFFRIIPKTDIPSWILQHIDEKSDGCIPNSVLDDVAKSLIRDYKHKMDKEELAVKGQFYLNLNNGVYNIETDEFIDGGAAVTKAKELCFTYRLDFNYIKESVIDDAPEFKHFLASSLDSNMDKRILLLEIIGICISSVQIARKFYILIGATKSGKSVIADFLHALILPKLAVSTFGLHQLNARFNTQHLEYTRLNICRELTAGKITGTDTIKMLVSDEPMFVEGKGKEGYVAFIHTKLFNCANQLPQFGEMDAAGNKSMTDRMILLRFLHTIPDAQIDKHLVDKLLSERDVICSSAIKALKALHDRNYEFTIPADSKELMETYLHDTISLKLFIEECCELSAEYRIHKADFIAAYKEFCSDNSLTPYKVREINAYIANCLPNIRKAKFSLNNKYCWGWLGIRIKTNNSIFDIKEVSQNDGNK